MSNLKSSYKIHRHILPLRTVPAFVTVHTFCASGDGLRKSSLKQSGEDFVPCNLVHVRA